MSNQRQSTMLSNRDTTCFFYLRGVVKRHFLEKNMDRGNVGHWAAPVGTDLVHLNYLDVTYIAPAATATPSLGVKIDIRTPLVLRAVFP